MKQWVRKLLDQFGMEWSFSAQAHPEDSISDEKATLLYIIDTYSKYLIDVEKQPVRKVRETFDDFAKALLKSDRVQFEKALFRFRQFFSSYRIDEYTYVQNTLDDFKCIIWDFADQLSEDVRFEEIQDKEIALSLNELREAVEANSIEDLRVRSREFIDFYVSYQTHKEERRNRRIDTIQKNLDTVKKKLTDAHQSARIDHLTGANNRRSFDEKLRETLHDFKKNHAPVTLVMLDIDYFKRINDVYGHDMGDFVLKECVRMLKEVFNREKDFFARIGGEEFAVILPNFRSEDAVKKAEQAMQRIRKEVILHLDAQVKFTISLGIAELLEGEFTDSWMKRADQALYKSKNTGRDRYTVAPPIVLTNVA